MQSNTLPPQDRTPLFCADIYPTSTFYQSSSPESIRQNLTSLAALLQKFIDNHCKDTLEGYIWYREALKITVADQTDNGEKPARLCAYMKHGGSVEDEWLAVHLLLLASETFQNELESQNISKITDSRTLCINIYDEDGQFLMIEGAKELPDWVQPNNADGRLWIMGGAFHLITLEHHPGDFVSSQPFESSLEEGSPLKHVTALELLQSGKDFLAPPRFTECLQRNRMPSFPNLKWAQDLQHSTLAYLPIVAAKIISRFPQLLADAAQAFEAREGPKDARILRDLNVLGEGRDTSQPEKSMQAFLIKIKLPRRMYATLLAERYFPPKVFGSSWRDNVMKYWDLVEKELKKGSKLEVEDEIILKEEGRRKDLGCKIVCGLELVHSNVKERILNNPKNLFDIQDDQVRSSASYNQFIQSLTNQGYFDKEVQDSYQWKQKEKEALRIWRSMMLSKDEADDRHASDDLAFVLDAVKMCTRDRSFPPHIDAQKSPLTLRLYEDPDDFLYDSSATESKFSTGAHPTDDENEDAEKIALQQLNAFSDKLQTFVEGEGDEVGALFEDEGLDGKGDKEEMEEDDTIEEERKKEALQKLIPPLPENEWGAGTGSSQQKQPTNMDTDADIVTEGVKNTSTTQSKEDRLAGFSNHTAYDGASDSDESIDDEILRAGDTEEDRINRARSLDIEAAFRQEEERYKMAVEDGDFLDDDEEWEDESDLEQNAKEPKKDFALGQNEMLNFLEFARKELGLSEEQYQDILDQRRSRGEYVPQLSTEKEKPNVSHKGKPKASVNSKKDEDDSMSQGKSQAYNAASDYEALKEAERNGKTFRQQTQENKSKSLRNERTTKSERDAARLRAERAVQEIEEQAVNKRMYEPSASNSSDPFQHLMDSMDAELLKLKQRNGKQKDKVDEKDFISLGSSQKATRKEHINEYEDDDDEDEDEEMMSAQDAELLEKMLHNGLPSSLQALLQKNDSDPSSMTNVERQVMDDMLKSYQSQMGQAGPVGNLLGRFGIGKLPQFEP